MDELNLLRKKTGMTIAKAWMLMISAILLFIVGILIVAVIAGYNKSDLRQELHLNLSWIMCSTVGICSLWGFFINKKQLPYFQKPSFSIIIVCVAVILAWFYVSPVITEILPFDSKDKENIDEQAANAERYLGLLFSILFTTLQVGIIGHGLLKNYLFKQVIITVVAVSMVIVVPQAVIGLFFQTIIIFYVYYRTASFQVPLLMTVILVISEEIFKFYFGHDITSGNYIHTHFILNDTFYYAGFVLSICIIIGGLFYIKKRTTPIAWQRPEEDEDIAFL